MTSLLPHAPVGFSPAALKSPRFGHEKPANAPRQDAEPAEASAEKTVRLPQSVQKLVALFRKGEIPLGSRIELKSLIHGREGHLSITGGRPALLGYTERVSFALEMDPQDKALTKALQGLDQENGLYEVTGTVTRKPGFWVGHGAVSIESIKQVGTRARLEDGSVSWKDESRLLYTRPVSKTAGRK